MENQAEFEYMRLFVAVNEVFSEQEDPGTEGHPAGTGPKLRQTKLSRNVVTETNNKVREGWEVAFVFESRSGTEVWLSRRISNPLREAEKGKEHPANPSLSPEEARERLVVAKLLSLWETPAVDLSEEEYEEVDAVHDDYWQQVISVRSIEAAHLERYLKDMVEYVESCNTADTQVFCESVRKVIEFLQHVKLVSTPEEST